MPALRETHTTKMKPIKGQVTRVPKVGEVVILKENLLPRGRWKLGRIESLIESGVDGVHRGAVIVTSLGKKLKRPYRHIYPLEAGSISNGLSEANSNSLQPAPQLDQGSSHIQKNGNERKNLRPAAQIAR